MTIKIIMLLLGVVLGILIFIPIHYYSRYRLVLAWVNTLENVSKEWLKESTALNAEIERLMKENNKLREEE